MDRPWPDGEVWGTLRRFGIPLSAALLRRLRPQMPPSSMTSQLGGVIRGMLRRGNVLAVRDVARLSITHSPYPDWFPPLDWRREYRRMWEESKAVGQGWWREKDHGGEPHAGYGDLRPLEPTQSPPPEEPSPPRLITDGDLVGEMRREFNEKRTDGVLIRYGIPLAAAFFRHRGVEMETILEGFWQGLRRMLEDIARVARRSIANSPYPDWFPPLDWREEFGEVWEAAGARERGWWRDEDEGGQPCVGYESLRSKRDGNDPGTPPAVPDPPLGETSDGGTGVR